jgi:hypothetical protein
LAIWSAKLSAIWSAKLSAKLAVIWSNKLEAILSAKLAALESNQLTAFRQTKLAVIWTAKLEAKLAAISSAKLEAKLAAISSAKLEAKLAVIWSAKLEAIWSAIESAKLSATQLAFKPTKFGSRETRIATVTSTSIANEGATAVVPANSTNEGATATVLHPTFLETSFILVGPFQLKISSSISAQIVDIVNALAILVATRATSTVTILASYLPVSSSKSAVAMIIAATSIDRIARRKQKVRFGRIPYKNIAWWDTRWTYSFARECENSTLTGLCTNYAVPSFKYSTDGFLVGKPLG